MATPPSLSYGHLQTPKLTLAQVQNNLERLKTTYTAFARRNQHGDMSKKEVWPTIVTQGVEVLSLKKTKEI